ncbi:MAG: hypothetical protein ACLSH6_09630 [Limosilactobacillus pontis]
MFASGIEYVFASALIFALGIPLFIKSADRLNHRERIAMIIIAILGVVALILIIAGKIKF